MKDISKWKVMKVQCKTCPFRTNEKGQHNDSKLVARIQQQVLTKASQICHHPQLYGKTETHLCRGARNYQLEIFYQIGFINAPTDEAWELRRQIEGC